MERFNFFVRTYLNNVVNSMSLLDKHSKDMSGYRQIRKGYLDEDKSLYFEFHGIGCLFINDGLKIDFEIPDLERGKIYVELYFILGFWKSSQEKFGYTEIEEIKADFEKAKSYPEYKRHPYRNNQIEASYPPNS